MASRRARFAAVSAADGRVVWSVATGDHRMQYGEPYSSNGNLVRKWRIVKGELRLMFNIMLLIALMLSILNK